MKNVLTSLAVKCLNFSLMMNTFVFALRNIDLSLIMLSFWVISIFIFNDDFSTNIILLCP